ncbi:MAG: type IV pili twitching motility protein PilT [Firmicutes bacterium HGW-Firmicutes-12]|nr:MAG: type IV pili twitching motility protein PilT [Firmicutes bacterium HGW-Firmicutes-12]
MMEVISLLRKALAMEASDIHFTVGTTPLFRVNGNLIRFEQDDDTIRPISQADTLKIIQNLMTPGQYETWQQYGELEFSYSLPGVGRFRVNAYRQRGCVSLAIRPVPYIIPTIEELNIPSVVSAMTEKKQGLILVTGPTGSGKSTTLAALVNKINQERNCYIITIEDPIEYLHQHQKSVIDQREIGGDTNSTAGALRSCLRQDPDVIMIGDMGDQETINTALTAAETGHLVLASLHTSNAVQTLEWIIDLFPFFQQEQIKVKLAAVLQGVVSQKLISGISTRELAIEVLVATSAVRSLIREGKNHQLPTVMQTGGRWGMQTMEMSIKELERIGRIGNQ